jgi:hypothetical protein
VRPYLLVGYRCNAGRPAAVKSLWGEPFGEGIPASLLRAFSFVRPPAQTAHTNCKRAKLSPILFPLFPHFKLHARFAYRYMFLHRCRNPFGGPALLATFHDLLKCELTIKRIYGVNSNQIRRPDSRLLPAKMIVGRFGETAFQYKASDPDASLGMTRPAGNANASCLSKARVILSRSRRRRISHLVTRFLDCVVVGAIDRSLAPLGMTEQVG